MRTVAEGVPEKDLRADMAFLIKMWNEVVAKIENARCPSLIYNDLDLLLRTVRDLFTADVEKLIIDSRPEYDRIKKFIGAFMPDFDGPDRAVSRAASRSSTATASRSRSTGRWSARSG